MKHIKSTKGSSEVLVALSLALICIVFFGLAVCTTDEPGSKSPEAKPVTLVALDGNGKNLFPSQIDVSQPLYIKVGEKFEPARIQVFQPKQK